MKTTINSRQTLAKVDDAIFSNETATRNGLSERYLHDVTMTQTNALWTVVEGAEQFSRRSCVKDRILCTMMSLSGEALPAQCIVHFDVLVCCAAITPC